MDDVDSFGLVADDSAPDSNLDGADEENDPIYYNAQPNVIAVATCGFENVEVTIFGKTKFKIDKDFSSLYIVITDIVVVSIFVLFIFILEKKQGRFQELYKDYMIQMDDFTVMITNLPPKRMYGFSSDNLRLQMWEHLTTVVKAESVKEGREEQVNDKAFQIVDITFVKKNTGDTQIIHKYSNLKQLLLQEYHRKISIQNNPKLSEAKKEK